MWSVNSWYCVWIKVEKINGWNDLPRVNLQGKISAPNSVLVMEHEKQTCENEWHQQSPLPHKMLLQEDILIKEVILGLYGATYYRLLHHWSYRSLFRLFKEPFESSQETGQYTFTLTNTLCPWACLPRTWFIY